MDAAKQAEGEARVMALLFEPLESLGLGRPTTTTREGYEKMKRTVCQCLAGHDDEVLRELQGWAQENCGGPSRDRVPNGAALLNKAGQIAPPQRSASASPLMRQVFAHETGGKAIKDGWAPELLEWFRDCQIGERRWPGRYTISQIVEKAYEPTRRLRDIEMRMAQAIEVSKDDADFRNARVAKVRECEEIRRVGLQERAA